MKSVFKPVSLIIAMTMIGSISLAQNGNGNGNNRRPDQSRDAWKNDNNNIITTDDFNGNIGVGTDNPIGNIHVFGDYGFQVILESDAPYNPDMSFAESGNNVAQIKYETGDNGLGFYVKDNNTAGYNGFGNSELGIFINGSNRNVGIGTHTPTATLDVNGNFKLVDGSQGQNKVLTSDASGNATWQTISYSNVFSDLYATDYLKVGNSSLYLMAPGVTTSGGTITSSSNHEIFADDTDLLIQSNVANGSFNTILNLRDGKVGIGSKTPDSKLFIDEKNISASTDNVLKIRGIGAPTVGGQVSYNYTLLDVGTQPAGLSTPNDIDSKFIVKANGNVGVGTNSPSKSLDVVGDASISGNVGIGTANPQATLQVDGNIKLKSTYGNASFAMENLSGNDIWTLHVDNTTGHAGLWKQGIGTHFRVTNTGQVMIGTETLGSGDHTDYKLSVDGKIVSKEIVVTLNDWADYVFNDSYDLMSITEVEEYIHKNKHLPNIPSEKQMIENGLDVKEMQKLQMQKIEELMLYVIELKKENEEQAKLIEQLIK